MSPDPFDLLRDQLVAAAVPAAAPQRRRRRARPSVIVAAALVLCGSATAAVLTLAGGQPSKPLHDVYAGESGPSARSYAIALSPNLMPGRAGWCTRVILRRGHVPVAGATGCGIAAASGTALIAGGGMALGRGQILVYAIVDRRVASAELAPGLRVVPRAEPALPLGWRAAVALVPTTRGALPGEQANLRLLDAHGREIDRSPQRPASTRTLPTRRVDPRHPPAVPCAITHIPLAHLRHVSQTIVRGPLGSPADVDSRALRTCSEAAFSLGAHRLRAALLVDASDPDRRAAPLPGARAVPGHPGVVDAPGLMSGRRVDRAWLVVAGPTLRERLSLLATLRVRRR
jgi:hypothetical protein